MEENLEKLQTAVNEQKDANTKKELLAQAKELKIDLKEYGLNEDGSPIETPETKPETKVVEPEKKLPESKGDTKENERKELIAGVVDAFKEVFKKEETKEEPPKVKIYG